MDYESEIFSENSEFVNGFGEHSTNNVTTTSVLKLKRKKTDNGNFKLLTTITIQCSSEFTSDLSKHELEKKLKKISQNTCENFSQLHKIGFAIKDNKRTGSELRKYFFTKLIQ